MIIFRNGLNKTASHNKDIPGVWEYAFNFVHSYSNMLKF